LNSIELLGFLKQVITITSLIRYMGVLHLAVLKVLFFKVLKIVEDSGVKTITTVNK
jgi:hypothetical protein